MRFRVELLAHDGHILYTAESHICNIHDVRLTQPLREGEMVVYGFRLSADMLSPEAAVKTTTVRADVVADLRRALALVYDHLSGDPAVTRDDVLNHLLALGLGGR